MTKLKSNAQGVANIGLIGFGVRLHSIVLRLLRLAEGKIRVRAVYDPDPSVAARVAEHFDGDVTICPSEEAFLANKDIDWVFIGSPNCLHARHVEAALRAGRDVFCEKPLATTLEDCLLVRDAVQSTGRTFAFGLVLRYSPFYQEIKRIIERGDIGDIVSFEFNETLDFDHGGRRIFSTWRRDYDQAGSHLLEKCCHDLDIANWLIGSLPVEVASFGGLNFFRPENAHHVERIGPSADGRLAYSTAPSEPNTVPPFSPGASIVDNQVAILQYANGVRATFHTNCNTAMRERRFYLCGTEGTLHGDAYTGKIEWRRIGYDMPLHSCHPVSGGGQGHAGGDDVMTANLIGAILDGGPLLAGVDDGIRACVAAFAIDEAMETRGVVNLDEIWKRCGIDPQLSGDGSCSSEGLPAVVLSEA